MSNTTLDYYNTHAEQFCTSTQNADMSACHHMFEQYLKPGNTILDLGCGSGRDSRHFLEQGYEVVSIDGSEEICKYASTYLGHPVLCKRFEELDYHEDFHGVWASASLLHAEADTLPEIIKKIWGSLKAQGIFYASFKYGSGEREKEGRFFLDHNENSIKELLEADGLFDILETAITQDVRPERSHEKWINVIAKKC